MEPEAIETVQAWMERVYLWLTQPLFTVGDSPFSATSVLKLVLFIVLVFWVSRWIRRTLAQKLLPRLGLETGLCYALANMISYAFVALGLLVGLQTSGVQLGTLAVLFGAMGVGIGFGLQNIASNFVSGLILLIERPIQVGDRIQVGELHGKVSRINIRATEILTNDNIAVIVPNTEFISQRVINWSTGGDWMRHKIPVGVAYASDVEVVRTALLEAAEAVPAVMRKPGPNVRLAAFGDSALEFELVVWTSELLHRRGEFISRVNYAIHASLARHGVEIPFPQRDLHLRSSVPFPISEPVPAQRTGG